MRTDAERGNRAGLGTDWFGRITGALWVGTALILVLQIMDLVPPVNGFSLVPFAAILAVVCLIILNIRDYRRGRVSPLATVGLGFVVGAILLWGAIYLMLPRGY